MLLELCRKSSERVTVEMDGHQAYSVQGEGDQPSFCIGAHVRAISEARSAH